MRTKRKLTKETESSSHHWVEVTAVACGYSLVRPVKLFGRVLDEEHHSLCYGDLTEVETPPCKCCIPATADTDTSVANWSPSVTSHLYVTKSCLRVQKRF